MSALNNLRGLRIQRVDVSEATFVGLNVDRDAKQNILRQNTLQIHFGEWMLEIMNPFRLIAHDSLIPGTEILHGKCVQNIIETVHEAKLMFDDDIELSIDLRYESFKGPEAMVLLGPNNLGVVWN